MREFWGALSPLKKKPDCTRARLEWGEEKIPFIPPFPQYRPNTNIFVNIFALGQNSTPSPREDFLGRNIRAVRVVWPKFDTLTARIFSGKKYSRGEGRLAKIRYPHRAYISKSDGLWYRPSKLKKVSTEMKLEKVSTESPSIVKL